MARQLKFTKLSWPLMPRHSSRCGLNQLRYDLRKMRAHGLLERDGHRYAYRLGIPDGGTITMTPEEWIDVPLAPRLELAGFVPNPAFSAAGPSLTEAGATTHRRRKQPAGCRCEECK